MKLTYILEVVLLVITKRVILLLQIKAQILIGPTLFQEQLIYILEVLITQQDGILILFIKIVYYQAVKEKHYIILVMKNWDLLLLIKQLP